jgi:hypothetical protein
MEFPRFGGLSVLDVVIQLASGAAVVVVVMCRHDGGGASRRGDAEPAAWDAAGSAWGGCAG